MSTDTRRSRSRARRGRRFGIAFGGVVAVLLVLGVVGAGFSVAQGPRLTGVQADPAAAIEVAGSRVILTANQALEPVDAAQVTVTPDVPFTMDASGRDIGVRFTVPLDGDTEYTVRVEGAQGIGGGPVTALETRFTTPPLEVFLLQRSGAGDDAIFRTDLTGERAVPVFTHPHIEDYRATSTRLVVSVIDDDGAARLVSLARDGSDAVDVALPGDGDIATLQVSELGDLVGYTYSDRILSEDEGLASVLFLSTLRTPDADPAPLEVAGAAPSVDRWRFVPDATAVLLIDFEGQLMLVDRSEGAGADPTTLGGALTIDGVTRGTYEAIVERIELGLQVIDLVDASEEPLVPSDDQHELGVPGAVTPVAAGGTVRMFSERDATGVPIAHHIAFVADDGETTLLTTLPAGDLPVQVCASPSGRYAAVTVATDLVSNPYDAYLQALPGTLETRIIEIDGAREITALTGFAISWCPTGPV